MKITKKLSNAISLILSILMLLSSTGICAAAEEFTTDAAVDTATSNTTDNSADDDTNADADADSNSDANADVDVALPDTDADKDNDINTNADNVKIYDFSNLYTYGDINSPNTKIALQKIGDTYTLVLPSTVSPSAVTLYFGLEQTMTVQAKNQSETILITDGVPFDLTALCPDGDYTVTLISPIMFSESISIKFLFSENISTVYLTSDDAESKGRNWVEESADKSNKATGSMIMQKNDSSIVYDGKLTQIKGRGNTTWELEKKPYQIKLETKTDLLETGDKKNASKTWVLLANYLDATLMRNSIALNLGQSLTMDDNINLTYVDLYYDGEYRGNYMLSEKVEVDNGRASITDMEEKNGEANPDTNLEELPVATAVTKNGATYTYCEGMTSPEDITGGYLLEMDYKVRALEEVCYFYTTRNQYVVVKSPEFASKEEMDYIASLYQEYEDAVYNNGTNPTTGKSYSDYVDAESIACYYLVNEFSKSRDCFKSSAYLHKEAGEDKMYMGPLWDYDMSFGKGGSDYTADDSPYGILAPESEFNMTLLSIEDFYQTVKSVYEAKFYPLIAEETLNRDIPTENSIVTYIELLAPSASCNAFMWHPEIDWQLETEKLNYFITVRKDFLKEVFEVYPSISNMPKESYMDVLPSQWHHTSITNASLLGFVKGYGNHIFAPDDNVTRAQSVQALFNISEDAAPKFRRYFTDIKADSWYTNAIIWAVENKICDVNDNKKFSPNENITREEFISFLYRHQGSPEVTTSNLDTYHDSADVSVSYKQAVEWSIANQIITGHDNLIEPTKNMTRAEFATILVRYHDTFLKAE